MTPDQPTGMNELREILENFYIERDNEHEDIYDPPKVSEAQAKAEAAIQQTVERSLPTKWELYGDAKSLSYHEALGFNQAIDQLRHNLQQAGLLRGDDV